MIWEKGWSLWAIIKSPKDISSTTPMKEIWWLIKMLSSMKKEHDGEKYNFLLLLNEKEVRYEDYQEQATIPQSPMAPPSLLSFLSIKSSSSDNPSNPPRRMKSLDELYKVTIPIDIDVTLYYHLTICDPIVFE